MEELKTKYLRPCRKLTDQFLIATILSVLILMVSSFFNTRATKLLPEKALLKMLGDSKDALTFLYDYYGFITIWVGFFLVVLIFRSNRPMLKGIKYDGHGNSIKGLLIGLALGFGTNGFCILMSVLMGDIHLSYSGFRLAPFAVFLICVFIQSAAEEIADRWYLYQKLRRRYKNPWFAIVINALVFMALHLLNPGISVLAVIQLFAVGMVFSELVYYYNGLWIAMAFHAGWNFTQSILFGLPNSGIVSAFSIFKLEAASGTNGIFYNVAFGVEGSPGAVVLISLVGVAIYLINRGKGEYTDVWAEAEAAATTHAA